MTGEGVWRVTAIISAEKYTETLYDYQDKKCTERGSNIQGPTYVRETFYIDDEFKYPDKAYYYSSPEDRENGKYYYETIYEYSQDMKQSYIKTSYFSKMSGDYDEIEEYKNFKYEDLARTYEYFYYGVKYQVIRENYLDKSHDKITRYYSEHTNGSLILDYRYTYDEYGKVTSYWRNDGMLISEYRDYEYSKGSCTYKWSNFREDNPEPINTYSVVEKYE